MQAVTKSGTNQIHGDAYEFVTNNSFDARNFFAPPGPSPQLVQDQFGGSLGAPIARNHAWIFGAYEGYGLANAATNLSTVPTQAMRNGDFGSAAIYDPATTLCNPTETTCTRTEFADNTIPQADLNSIGQSILNRYPLPNLSGLANNCVQNSPQDSFNHNAIFRGDVQLSSRSSMFARLALTRYHILANAALPEAAQTPVLRRVDTWGVGYGFTRTFSSTLVNEFRFSWDRFTISQDATMAYNQIIPGMLDPGIHSSIPTFSVTGFTEIGNQASCCTNDPLDKSSGVWDVADNATKSMGRQLMKFGVESLYIRPTTDSALNGRGSMGFTGVFTQDPLSRSGTGSPVADLLLGDANSLTTGTVAAVVERGHYFGAYFQDDVSATRNLTLNLGLRWDFFPPYIEGDNRMANFILAPNNPDFGHLVLSGNPAFPRALMTADYRDFAPRVGFAYRIPKAKNLVVRGAYGIFYAQDDGWGITSRMTNNPPFYGYGGASIVSDELFPSSGFVLSPTATAPRLPPISPSAFVLSPTATSALRSWPLEYTTPYVQEWNLTVEKQLPWNMLWRTSYVGNIGLYLYGQSQGNQPLTNGPGSPTTRRPLAKYTEASVMEFSPWDRSHYEGASTELEKQFGSGLLFMTDFTYSKAMDLYNPALDVCDGCGSSESVQNSYDLNSLLGNSAQDAPFRFTFSGTWSLPFGAGQRLASQGWEKVAFGGWQVDGVYQAQPGYPFTPTLSFDNANAGNTSFPNRICSGSLSSPILQEWFNTSCFVTPPEYQFGNSGRDILFGPGINNLDFALHRSFKIPWGELTQLQFRAEAFNFLNHPQFGEPGSTQGTSTFGVIGATSVANREVQFALRLVF